MFLEFPIADLGFVETISGIVIASKAKQSTDLPVS
jgi:hypothetical protein